VKKAVSCFARDFDGKEKNTRKHVLATIIPADYP
jgi:hypothetical protein